MSVIVWVRGEGMASDTEVSWAVRTRCASKMIPVGPHKAIGAAGPAVVSTWLHGLSLDQDRTVEELARLVALKLRLWLKHEGHVEVDDAVNSGPFALLVASRDECWTLDGAGSVDRVQEPYAAVGSGAPVAYGALHAIDTLRRGVAVHGASARAVYAAIRHAHGCGGDCVTLDLAPLAARGAA